MERLFSTSLLTYLDQCTGVGVSGCGLPRHNSVRFVPFSSSHRLFIARFSSPMPTPHPENVTLDLPAIALRARQMLAAAGLDGTEFAAQVGVPYSTMRAYLGGIRPPGPEFLVGCFRAFGFMPSWLLTGDGPMARPGSELGNQAGQAWNEEYVTIPVLALQASAGNGTTNDQQGEYRVGGLCFSRGWLAGKRLSRAGLRVIQVRGSSMQPMLSNGDQVLIDQGDTHPRSGFAFVIRQGDELLVKYCQLLPGGLLRVSSANPTYAAYDVDLTKSPDVAIVGRVVASMHEW